MSIFPRIEALARPLKLMPSAIPAAALPPPGQRIALARDAAFSFLYPHLLSGWRAAGAELRFFSPLADEPPPEDCDACWLPGGYPELHAGQLAGAARFREGLRRFARARPVHGECGGYMALGAALTDASGARHQMAGLLGVETSFAKRRMTLGYREATLEPTVRWGPPARGFAAMNSTMRRSYRSATTRRSRSCATLTARRRSDRVREEVG